MNRRAMLSSAFAAGVLLTSAAPALAHGPHVSVSIGIHVPPHIASQHVVTYRPYYMGHVWFRPHRHVHTVYAFPVRGAFVPHVYCGGVLVSTGSIPGYDPRFDDRAAGYDAVVWDGPLHPSHPGFGPRFAPGVVYRERRYGDGSYRVCEGHDGRRVHRGDGRGLGRRHGHGDGCGDDD
jgi:hypothetical protein